MIPAAPCIRSPDESSASGCSRRSATDSRRSISQNQQIAVGRQAATVEAGDNLLALDVTGQAAEARMGGRSRYGVDWLLQPNLTRFQWITLHPPASTHRGKSPLGMPLVPNKFFGAALIRLPETPQAYLQGGAFEIARRKCRQAIKAGFVFRRVRALDFIDDMLAINSSLPVRQGRPMDTAYLDRQQVRSFCEHAGELYGVLSSDGKLAAYAHVPICGDVAIFSRLLGHEAYLKNATMYLLVAESVREMIRIYQHEAHPIWVAYDMFLGAKPGLAQFKRAVGFRPYRVSWRWRM